MYFLLMIYAYWAPVGMVCKILLILYADYAKTHKIFFNSSTGKLVSVLFKPKQFCVSASPIIFLVQTLCLFLIMLNMSAAVEYLKHRTREQHGLGSKPTHAIVLCPWERHFTALSPAWWSW